MNIAPYAIQPNMATRLYPEKQSQYRNPFQRDRARVLHSNAFRRSQYKTQVFIYHEGDHYRNRLTHTLEVSQVARTIAIALNIDQDLTETIALAHDLGHTAFGHAGEERLNEEMKNYGGFSHNIHTLKLLTKLEQHYPSFDGLNLTNFSIEGIIKHNGPVKSPDKFIKSLADNLHINLNTSAFLESQVASLSDDIAYTCHDIEDGIRAGFIKQEDLGYIDLCNEITHNLQEQYPNCESKRLDYSFVRNLVGILVSDLLQQSTNNLKEHNISNYKDLENITQPIITFSHSMSKTLEEIRKFLFSKIYRHPNIIEANNRGKNIISFLFNTIMNDLSLLSDNHKPTNDLEKAEKVSNYIAGMTDRFAIEMAQSLGIK